MNNNYELKKLGLRATSPRLKILRIFEEKKSLSTGRHHMSAEDVYQQLLKLNEEIALATIYRVLTQFENAGLLIRHNFESTAVYELDDGKHHDHLVCIKCGHLYEFFDIKIEKQQEKVAKSYNFLMTDHSLVIYGVCLNCQ